jgi:hypothetical protein
VALHFGSALFKEAIPVLLKLSSLLPDLESIVRWMQRKPFLSGADPAATQDQAAPAAGLDPARVAAITEQLQSLQELVTRLDAALSGLSREVAALSAARRTDSERLERMESLLALVERRLRHYQIAVAVAAAAALVAGVAGLAIR